MSQVQLLQTFVTLAIAATINGEHVGVGTWATALLVVLLVLADKQLKVRRANS